MKKIENMKKLVVISLVSLVAGTGSFAFTLVDAGEITSNLNVKLSSANLALANAGNDPLAIAAAQAEINRLSDALGSINTLTKDMEKALANDNQKAADAAYNEMIAASEAALNPPKEEEKDVPVKPEREDGDGVGNEFPNIHEDLSGSETQREISDLRDASLGKGGSRAKDNDVTPN